MKPRRPQVGDEVDVSWDSTLPLPAKVYEVGADNGSGEAYFRARSKEGPHARCVADEGTAWRWPATQGAAVAGPARSCGYHTDCALADALAQQRGHGPERHAPPPPASEPHPYAAGPSGACVHCGERRCCHDLDAALEVQLRESRQTRDNLAFNYGTLVTERDALAAQLKETERERDLSECDAGSVVNVLDRWLEEHRAEAPECRFQDRVQALRDLIAANLRDRPLIRALAASGPAKEGA